MLEKGYETYNVRPAVGGGFYFYTDCGNTMYYCFDDPDRYHGCLCPKCFWENKYTTLLKRGSEDAKRILGDTRDNLYDWLQRDD